MPATSPTGRTTREVIEDVLDRALQAALRANLDAIHTDPLRAAIELLPSVDRDATLADAELARLARYTDRLESTNSVLTGRLASLQEYAEQLVQTLGPALDEITTAFHRASQLKSASGQPIARLEFYKRGRVTDTTLDAVREAPLMAHHGD